MLWADSCEEKLVPWAVRGRPGRRALLCARAPTLPCRRGKLLSCGCHTVGKRRLFSKVMHGKLKPGEQMAGQQVEGQQCMHCGQA